MTDSGIEKALSSMSDALDKKSDANDTKIDEAKAAADAYKSIEDTCNIAGGSGGGKEKETSAVGMRMGFDCTTLRNSCKLKKDSASDGDPTPIGSMSSNKELFSTLKDYFGQQMSSKWVDGEQGDEDEKGSTTPKKVRVTTYDDSKVDAEYKKAMAGLGDLMGKNDECDNMIQQCMTDVETKHDVFKDATPMSESGTVLGTSKSDKDPVQQ